MTNVNTHFKDLKREYIFPVIDKKLEELREKYPASDVLNLGVGDIALPLAPSIVRAICHSVEEMGEKETMRGYGPSEGYPFLREAIARHDYGKFGIDPSEVFISDGINSDIVNILDLFSKDNRIAIPNPSYPAYLDSSIMDGRKSQILILPCIKETGFLPKPPEEHVDIIFFCSPCNPTGVAFNRQQLTEWVHYAKRTGAVLLCDNAYAAFVTSPDVPSSIYEIEGAKDVAIEFRSFSKSAGFTGLRCAYVTIPRSVKANLDGERVSLQPLWLRRQSTKFNGVAYPIQKGAEAVFSEIGKRETKAQIDIYLKQAKRLREGLLALGYNCYGGTDSPYIWWETPGSIPSWDFFDVLLNRCHLISIPGKGFGVHGEGYIRLSTFTTENTVTEALRRIGSL